MRIKEFAESVHQVAVDHGWHDPRYEADRLEYIAMIHCEWSEAVQQYREGRPNLWRGAGGKPEGVLVELADGVLRILDFLVEAHVSYWQWDTFGEMIADVPPEGLKIPFPVFIARLHEMTAKADGGGYLNFSLLDVMACACAWIQKEGEACEAVLIAKNEYNKTREYRHGGKKC